MIEHHKNKHSSILTEEGDDSLYVEEWKDISGWEGYYQISSFGRVKSLARAIPHPKSGTLNIKQRFLAQHPDKDGYLLVVFGKQNGKYPQKVHRLVAKAFLPNPKNLPEVNHKWGIKKDNRYWKIEWSTPKDNTNHAFRVLKRNSGRKGKFGKLNIASIPVHCSTLNICFDSMSEAQRELGLTGVGEVCNGNLIHTKGLVFRKIIV